MVVFLYPVFARPIYSTTGVFVLPCNCCSQFVAIALFVHRSAKYLCSGKPQNMQTFGHGTWHGLYWTEKTLYLRHCRSQYEHSNKRLLKRAPAPAQQKLSKSNFDFATMSWWFSHKFERVQTHTHIHQPLTNANELEMVDNGFCAVSCIQRISLHLIYSCCLSQSLTLVISPARFPPLPSLIISLLISSHRSAVRLPHPRRNSFAHLQHPVHYFSVAMGKHYTFFNRRLF